MYTKLTSGLINQFNSPSTLIVFGSYPQIGSIHDKNKDALASFTKNRVDGLLQASPSKIVVITHTDQKPTIEIDGRVLILRIFQKNHPSSFLRVLCSLNKFSMAKSLLIEFEFSTFGDNLMTLSFLHFLAALKFKKIRVTIELHQVLTKIEALRGHLGYKKHSFKARILNPALLIFYRLLGLLSDEVIVLESHLKKHLSGLIADQKIVVLPHGVQEIKTTITPSDAKRKLGFSKDDFVVLSFGYLTWYKGSDLFVEAAKQLTSHPQIHFVLAGGPSYNQKHKKHYRLWYQKLLTKISQTNNLIYTDFIEEKDLSLYYQAADLVVFPYRTFMSSSGPLSLALSHAKPFILSKKLRPYLYSQDVKQFSGALDISQSSLLFATNPQSLNKRLIYFSKCPQELIKLHLLSQKLATERSYANLGLKQNLILTSKSLLEV